MNGIDILKEKLKSISHRPGVYRMIDTKGKVLYVGKAKDLKNRLTSYTRWDELNIRLRMMVSHIADVITVEVAGETQALLLENELIKRYQPPYNILLKDDKSFPYIVLTKEEFPRMMRYRGIRHAGQGQYFGPFASGLAVQETLRYLQKMFGLRTCAASSFSHRSRPCLLYQIGLCRAPCCGLISAPEYQNLIHQTIAFMQGKNDHLCDELKDKMQQAADAMDYEAAARWRDKLVALNHVRMSGNYEPVFDTDFIGLFRTGNQACVQVFFYRHGTSGGTTHTLLTTVEDIDDAALLAQFVLQFYHDVPPPKCLITPVPLSGDVMTALSQIAGFAVVNQSQHLKGRKKELLLQAIQNAEQMFHQDLATKSVQIELWNRLKDMLGLKKMDKIEVYDNSHFQGACATGAMIAVTPEGFQKKLYRRYNIASEHVHDDFAMMREVLQRRITRGLRENDLPDVLVIDGGKGQVSAVQEVLKDLNASIAILGVAKGPHRNAGHETLFTSAHPEGFQLPFKDELLFFIQRIRDEAHRFAIGTHRVKRQKAMIAEPLLDIPGIGAKRQKQLLQHFGSVRGLRGASVQELSHVPGISQDLAEKIVAYFHG